MMDDNGNQKNPFDELHIRLQQKSFKTLKFICNSELGENAPAGSLLCKADLAGALVEWVSSPLSLTTALLMLCHSVR